VIGWRAVTTSELAVGLTSSQDYTVEGPLLTTVGGLLPRPVLSTPGMIGTMERTAAMAIQPHLPEGKFTVGFEVCVKHIGAVFEGATITATATLREIVDDRKFRFDVEVHEGDRLIGTGTHERRIPAS
jgi:fluoroacetyl-CoA thioesterase